jgi:hypothetical protein
MERTGDRALTLVLDGGETCTADVGIVRLKRHKLGKVTLTAAHGDVLRPYETSPDRIAYHVPASGSVMLTWE